jgi:hypothetical protein
MSNHHVVTKGTGWTPGCNDHIKDENGNPVIMQEPTGGNFQFSAEQLEAEPCQEQYEVAQEEQFEAEPCTEEQYEAEPHEEQYQYEQE